MAGERNVLDKLSAAHNVLRQKAGYFFAPGQDEVGVTCVTPHKQGAIRWRKGGPGVADSLDVCINNASDDDVWEPLNVSFSAPTGTIWMWSLSTAPPGWIIADGSAIDRSSPLGALYVADGLPYGPGDGSTTVNIPNLKGRVVVGVDPSDSDWDTLGETRGQKDVLLTANQSGLRAHNHTGDGGANTVQRTATGANTAGLNPGPTSTAGPWDAAETHTNIQPSLAMHYIVKE